MKNTRKAVLAGALALALASTACLAHKPKPFEVDFDKCFAHAGPDGYLFTFAGPVSGDIDGFVEARIIRRVVGIEPGQNLLQADYVVTGELEFTARVGGRVNAANLEAVLYGYVSAGPAWLEGARVHDEFTNYTRADGVGCSKGTLYITPRWKQSHHDDND
jgi:hypothetical protein